MSECAVLFTDLVDSTRLAESLGDAHGAELWVAHDRRARDLLAQHHGREIDRADGFLLLFETAAGAAAFVVAYHATATELDLKARAGLQVGPVTLRENSSEDVARGAKPSEVEGLAKPIAARLMALAQGGQTLLSEAARKALGTALPERCEIENHGHYRLKGLPEPCEVFELGVRGLSPFAPPPDVEKAYRVVRAGDLWRPVREVRHNLPAERDAFVGRQTELVDLSRRLDGGARLLTVLGPGGTGKTRFVRRYGWTWLGDWPGGVYFCDISEARAMEGILHAVASAIDVPLGKDDPVIQIGHAIAGRGRCLVILDNFEQVAGHATATLGKWVDRAADATFVVTSRERLHLQGEEILPLEPLPIAREAIDLFADRAKAQQPDFVLDDTNRAAVAEVVRLLDGLPLAIELAAARVRVLSPAQLVERMRDRFRLLVGARGPAARQATLKAAIDWSWNLLIPWEKAALAQCSIFEGGFTLEAAEAVLDLAGWPEAPPPMDAVQALVDKSLLRSWVPVEYDRFSFEEPYFGMYVSVHDYAAEKLRTGGEIPDGGSGALAELQARERHGRHFARLGTPEAIESLDGHGGVRRRCALALDLDNLTAACRSAVERGDGETAVAAYVAGWGVLELRGPSATGMILGREVLAPGNLTATARARALFTVGRASWSAGRMEEGKERYQLALDLYRQVGDRRAEGHVLAALGIMHADQGRMEEAREVYEQAIAIHREVGNRRGEGNVIANLGLLLSNQGRLEAAREHYEQALRLHREVGNRRSEGIVLGNLGLLHANQGRLELAREHYEQATAIHLEVGNRRQLSLILGNMGILHGDQGRKEDAEEHFERALAISREVGDRRHEGIFLGYLAILHQQQGASAKARELFERALPIVREVADRRSEGAFVGGLGRLYADQGRLGEARDAFAAGERLLRDLGDMVELGKVLCAHAAAELKAGEVDAVRGMLAEAESLAAATGAGPDSELGREIAKLREALQ